MRGFTLLELLVVISIIAILTVVAVPSFNQYSQSQKLNEAANNLQSVLRQAQNNAQAGTVCNTSSGIKKATHWRVNLNKVSPGNKYYSMDPICENGSVTAQPTNLPEGVTISNLIFNGSCNPNTIEVHFGNVNSGVSFFDPDLGCLDNSSTVNANLEITLSLAGTTLNKIIVVEKGGGIYVKQ